jgi:peptidyl-prolyl cis-trans isomerase B (cyclophilin B)
MTVGNWVGALRSQSHSQSHSRAHGRAYGWVALLAIALVIGGCSQPDTSITRNDLPKPEVAAAITPSADELTAGLPKLNGKATVEIVVGNKAITVELDGDKAPYTAGNFVDLAQKGVYDGTIFHRVVRSPDPFVVQGGDPQSTDPAVPISQLGTGSYEENGQARMIPLEILPVGAEQPIYGRTFPEAGVTGAPALPHRKGAIAMARSGVNTASAQFYITLADVAFLDGNYAVFGYVTKGMDVVDNIQVEDVITSVTVKTGAENLVQPSGASGAAGETSVDEAPNTEAAK